MFGERPIRPDHADADATNALDALFAGYGERPDWSLRHAAMLRQCRATPTPLRSREDCSTRRRRGGRGLTGDPRLGRVTHPDLPSRSGPARASVGYDRSGPQEAVALGSK